MTQHSHDDDARHPAATSSAQMWDEMYSARPKVWSGRPNPQLVREAAGLRPGKALDLGCGEGADALWLAGLGWTVTAVDVSAVALKRAKAHADTSGHDHGGRIMWEQHDLAEWTPAAEFALVSAQFLHSSALAWQHSLAAAAAGVHPGGTLLIVGHHPEHLPPWGSHVEPDMFFTPEAAAAELGLQGPAWQLEVCTVRERTITDPNGHDAVVGDAVVRATRLVTGT